jgi:integrase
MLNDGIAPIVVSKRQGHSKTSTTFDVYNHLFSTMQAEAAEKIETLVTPIKWP